MPDDLRNQTDSLRNLVPAATRLAGEADRLALALTRLGDDLETLEGVTQTYDQTPTEASATIDKTGSTLGRNLWLLQIALVAMAIAGVILGVGLIAMSRFVELNLSTGRVEGSKALTARSEERWRQPLPLADATGHQLWSALLPRGPAIATNQWT